MLDRPMNQVALNLIAIGVFAVVMMSLLGPMLHLSPLVPAIATAGFLGLATVDTLGWQGQGSTLLLDWFAQRDPEHRQRIVHHEAGHFLVARLLDIPVAGYTLSAWEALRQQQPGQGGVSFDSSELQAELQQGRLSVQLFDRYCQVWMAGIAAETLTYGNAEGGNHDRQCLRLAMQQVGRSPADCRLKERSALLQAKHLLQTHEDAYRALVAAMSEGQPVEACDRIIATYRTTEVASAASASHSS